MGPLLSAFRIRDAGSIGIAENLVFEHVLVLAPAGAQFLPYVDLRFNFKPALTALGIIAALHRNADSKRHIIGCAGHLAAVKA